MNRLFIRTVIRASRPLFIRPIIKPVYARTIITSIPRYEKERVDKELLHQIEEEIELEEHEVNRVPTFIKDFLTKSAFQLDDRLGYDEVALHRTYQNEKIKVIFAISDIKNREEELKKREFSFPVRASVTIRKEGNGNLVIELTALDGDIQINTVRFFKEGEIDPEKITAQNIRDKRQDLYMGPDYDTLDEDFQTTFLAYLEERGIDTALAAFLPDYIDYKEQKEYYHWLKELDTFVSA